MSKMRMLLDDSEFQRQRRQWVSVGLQVPSLLFDAGLSDIIMLISSSPSPDRDSTSSSSSLSTCLSVDSEFSFDDAWSRWCDSAP